jgi:GR25 family glycosyltransferase involved in LPS biosynthesis
MDRNKSTYKLHNFGPVYYINLDDQPERREFMESQFKYWEIDDYTRISAYDGRNDDLSDIIKGKYPDNVTTAEIGCLTSHLKAIKYWYDNSDTPYAIFMEDDCIIDIAKYWNFTWQEFLSRVPYAWDGLQLCLIVTGDIHVTIHKHQMNEFSTACYAITRRYAKKLIDLHCRDKKYKLDQDIRPRAVADDLIYNAGITYSTPLFLYKLELGSTIHPDHVETFHRNSYNGLKAFWENKGSELSVEQITAYNPYFNSVIGSSGQGS